MNEANSMHDSSALNGGASSEPNFSELGTRIVADAARIVGAEARLVEADLTAAVLAVVDRAYLTLVLSTLAMAGVIAVVAGAIFLLHLWLPWWLSLGGVGASSIIVAELGRHFLMSWRKCSMS